MHDQQGDGASAACSLCAMALQVCSMEHQVLKLFVKGLPGLLTRHAIAFFPSGQHLWRGPALADQCVQSMPEASHTKWHLAQTSWFLESVILTPCVSGSLANGLATLPLKQLCTQQRQIGSAASTAQTRRPMALACCTPRCAAHPANALTAQRKRQ
jgi:hypothetical protein